jgi:hypothetical protein
MFSIENQIPSRQTRTLTYKDIESQKKNIRYKDYNNNNNNSCYVSKDNISYYRTRYGAVLTLIRSNANPKQQRFSLKNSKKLDQIHHARDLNFSIRNEWRFRDAFNAKTI